MHKIILFLCITMLAGKISAAGLTDLEMVGRFAELERAAERQLSALPQPNTSVLGPLCLAYSRVKRYGKLFDCLDQLERLIDAGDTVLVTDKAMISDSDVTPLPNMLRAEAFIELGDYRRAVAEANKALHKVNDRLPYGVWPAKRHRISLLGTLSLAYALGGEREKALETVKQLEDFPIGFMGNAIIGPLRNNGVARTHAALGDFRKALEFVRDDDGLWRRTVYSLNNAAWGYSGDDQVEIFVMLPKLLLRAKCLAETGGDDEAKKALDTILHHARIADHGELYWLTLFERGRIAERENNALEATSLYSRAVDVIELQRSTINTEANKIGFVGDKQQVYARLVALLVQQGKIAEAFDYVERSKSRALVDLLASKQDFALASDISGRARQALAQFDAADFAARVQGDGAPAGSASRGRMIALQEIRSSAPEFSSLVSVSSAPLAELRALLGAGETLIEYYYQDKDLYVFMADQERLQAVKLDGDGLVQQIQEFRRALEDIGSEAWKIQAQALYQRLWAPVETMGAVARAVVVPHGALHYLPFAALQRHDGTMLIEQTSVRMLPSASVLKFLRPALAQREPLLLVLGNPDLGDKRLDLQFAEVEARNVADLYPGSRVLLRKEASKSNLRKMSPSFSRIHLATHGKFQADNPLASGLYLAPDADNDGILSAGELYSMNLDADLVTLSACETGLGQVANGDDVVGLSRGFLYAGSRSVVATLWSVDDEATAELMKSFYRNLARMNKVEALRQAQLETRQSFAHPFFWSAFLLTGKAD